MFSATWMGLFLNLLLALLLSWTIIAAIWITGSYPSTKIIATVCLLLVVIISTYGVWNAFHPRVKKLEVGFENLPAQWENKVIVQLSGHTHAGQIFPFGNLTNLIYKGYDYGLKRIGNFSIYTTSGVGTWGPPMRTGSSPEIVLIKMKAL
jgi:predicted MPP superfamily phosphohydrolase